MTPQWVELVAKHPKHGDVGKKLELPENIANQLVEDGFAKACEKPADDTSPEAKALVETFKTVIKTEVDGLRAELKEETKSFNTSLTKHFGSMANPAQPKDDALEARYGFKSVNEFCHAVRDAGTPGARRDERLYSAKAPTGMNTIVGEDGGFLVPTEMSNNIMEMVFNSSNLLSRTDQHVLSGGSIELKALNETSRATGSRRGGVRAYWLDEAEQYTASKPKFRKLLLKPHKLGVFYYATDEQLADTQGYNLEQKLTQYAGEEITWMVDDAILNGDGVGKPLGIMNSGAKIAIAKEGTPAQAAATVVWQNFIKAYSRMLPGSLGRAVWLVNSDVMPSLLSMVGPKSDGTSMIYTSGNGYPTAAGAPFGTILGRPVIPCEQCATLGTEGDVIFADLGWYATATKGGVRQAMSIHLRFDYGETAFRYDFRVDGQPWLASALTPANGTATQSPFITFAVRA